MKTMIVSLSLLLGLLIANFAAAQPPAAEKPAEEKSQPAKTKPAAKKLDQAALDKQFKKNMTNVTLVGHFTDSNRPSDKLTEERYTIVNVTKDKGDYWIILVRIQYGKNDIKVPLRLPVKWAGDTAVISVTNFGVPLLGTYSARVVIYEGKYAGTWSGKTHGGHLFGKIVKNEAKPKKPDSK